MSVLEFLGAAWILSVATLTLFAAAAAVQGWKRRRRLERLRVDPQMRGLVERLREAEHDRG